MNVTEVSADTLDAGARPLRAGVVVAPRMAADRGALPAITADVTCADMTMTMSETSGADDPARASEARWRLVRA
jgi:hypothetical protein